MHRIWQCLWTLAGILALADSSLAAGCAIESTPPNVPPTPPSAQDASLNPDALRLLLQRAEATHSDSLVILSGGCLIGEWHFNKFSGPVQTRSATKSVVSLAIGLLQDSRKLKSLDERVSDFYPEWRQGRKRYITVGQLLNHTSGLEDIPSPGAEIGAAELSCEPGMHFQYNNKAVNLVAGIVQKASGMKLDDFLKQNLFKLLDIDDMNWIKDQSGNPYGMAGLEIKALDFAKLGQLMLNRGTWNGKRVINESWIQRSLELAQAYNRLSGLLWWLYPKWKKYTVDDGLIAEWNQGGIDPEFVNRMAALKGKILTGPEFDVAVHKLFPQQELARWMPQLEHRGLMTRRLVPGPTLGYYAEGYEGQYLFVVPFAKLVVARQIRHSEYRSEEDDFADFYVRVMTLANSVSTAGIVGQHKP